jgi:hypothetical protein
MCMSTTPAPDSATAAGIAGSPSAVTPLITAAPAVRTLRATSALEVSTETQAPSAARGSTTGSNRRSCSSADTPVAPGRVLSAPRSTRSAPSAINCLACAIASAGMRYRPPSENESGVTLTTPITSVRRETSNARSRQRQIT